MPERAVGERDATGERSVSLAKIVRYHRTILRTARSAPDCWCVSICLRLFERVERRDDRRDLPSLQILKLAKLGTSIPTCHQEQRSLDCYGRIQRLAARVQSVVNLGVTINSLSGALADRRS
jgi:hypothetical protein